jgi:hypothetical protein
LSSRSSISSADGGSGRARRGASPGAAWPAAVASGTAPVGGRLPAGLMPGGKAAANPGGMPAGGAAGRGAGGAAPGDGA